MQIGDANKTVRGLVDYTISYDYDLGADFNDGYDELYLNLIGPHWECPIEFAVFSVRLPYVPQEQWRDYEAFIDHVLDNTYMTSGAYGSTRFDWDKGEVERQTLDAISALPIDSIEDLSADMVPQDELDALVGKTGQELLDDGWAPGYGYNLENNEFWLYYGPFCYTVYFDGEFEEDDEIYDDTEYFKDHTVTSAEFNSLGDITRE
jgi:hypothetical protein